MSFGNLNFLPASLCTLPSKPPSSEFLIVEQATLGFEMKVSLCLGECRILIRGFESEEFFIILVYFLHFSMMSAIYLW